MSEWQPIETAPKDGTRIMVYRRPRFGKFAYELVCWDDQYMCWEDGSYLPNDYDTGHWMPLPEPPSAP